VRVSFAGELGWEIHTRREDTPPVFDAVLDAGERHGLRPFGMMALDSLRIEKGYRAWKGDLSTDYTILQAGLERFIDWDKPAFRGKAALEAEQQRGVTRRFVGLTVRGNPQDAPYMASLRHAGAIVGEVTSGGWGHRVGASIALGTVRADLAAPGTRLEISIFGEWYPAEVHDGPHYDPANARLRA
jgi:dimethylglycine dehydrogenase